MVEGKQLYIFPVNLHLFGYALYFITGSIYQDYHLSSGPVLLKK